LNGSDIFVGGVGITIGVAFLGAAILNWNWWFQMPKGRWLAQKVGRTGARIVFATAGTALVALGIAIILGFSRR
jgi:small neutral amino acid transporter SnatA (MarC family)